MIDFSFNKIFRLIVFIFLLITAYSNISRCSNNKIKFYSSSDSLSISKDSLIYISPDSTCTIQIYYPVVSGLADTITQSNINCFLDSAFTHEAKWYTKDCEHKIDSIEEKLPYKIYYYDADFKVSYISQKFLSVENSFSTFSGGAHPNHMTECYNFDLKDNGKILKLSDILISGVYGELTKLAENKLKEDYKTDNLRNAGFFENHLSISNKNEYIITDSSLVLQFNTYEIAPYVMGEIRIELPFNEIKDLLKPDAPFINKE